MQTLTPEPQILTKSQPDTPLLDAAFALGDCVVRALFYCRLQGMRVPPVVEQMLLCVIDALESQDLDYIHVAHERFDIVASGAVYGRSVWMEEVCV